MTKKMQNIDADSPEAKSADLVAENIARLKALFPELVTEGENGASVNVDVLKQLVGDQTVTDADEKYGLNWFGKRKARQLALTPSLGTLRPAPEESVDWETTQNLMIEGDNLEVLKLLQKSYAGKVKLIYIDPPYNTGKDFVYPDDFRDGIGNYQKLMGWRTDEGEKVSSLARNSEASGRYHTDWLNMMYPRLCLAKQLMKKDGVLAISIDDNESANLRTIGDEIFGEHNLVAELIWSLSSGPQAGHFTRAHETILVYARDKESLPNFSDTSGGSISHGALKKISAANPASEITFPAGSIRFEGGSATFGNELGGSEKQYVVSGRLAFKDGVLAEDVTIRAGWAMKNQVLSWLKGNETVDSKGQKVKRFYFNPQGILFYEKERGTIHPKTVIPSSDVGSTKTGSDEVAALLDGKLTSFPKPTGLVRFLCKLMTSSNDIVLDFFAGSGTTGHAVMAQNLSDAVKRVYIAVQLPEPLNASNDTERAAVEFCDTLGKPHTIAELTKERLRRAGAKIKAENPEWNGDTGFRVFKLDSSNLRAWDPDRDNLEQTLLDHAEHVKPDRTENDLLYELLLKLGLDLCVPIEKRHGTGLDSRLRGNDGLVVHSVGGGVLMACLAADIGRNDVEALAQGIVAWHKEQAPVGETTCVFRDSAFPDEASKANMTAILEQAGITHVRSL